MGLANELRGTAWKVSKYGVFFWSVFLRTRENSVFGHFSHSEKLQDIFQTGGYKIT